MLLQSSPESVAAVDERHDVEMDNDLNVGGDEGVDQDFGLEHTQVPRNETNPAGFYTHMLQFMEQESKAGVNCCISWHTYKMKPVKCHKISCVLESLTEYI